MINNKKLNQFTLVDIIERNIHFLNTNTAYDRIAWQDHDEGELLAYTEMLADVRVMHGNEFERKYRNILDQVYEELGVQQKPLIGKRIH